MTQAWSSSSAVSAARRPTDPPRSDARHNRERILTAAREALTASADASLNSIAKNAGVGPGTLYRHFPSREALVLAVYEEDVQTLAGAAGELLAQHPPLRALRLWFDHLAAYGAIKHSLADALHSVAGDSPADALYRQIVGAAARLLSACQRDGSIRPDIEACDVLLMLSFLGRIEPGPDGAERAARLLDLIISGLAAGTKRRVAIASLRRRSRPRRRRPRQSVPAA
jgi:AcrR family transcriptional regulator